MAKFHLRGLDSSSFDKKSTEKKTFDRFGFFWSALASALISASAGAKEASNSTKFFFFCLQP